MRIALAASLALLLLVSAVSPHVHSAARGTQECAVCLVRGADVPRSEVPDLAPLPSPESEPPAIPDLAPLAGAPQGAVPGQSPPAA
jgi:hypothetical protein